MFVEIMGLINPLRPFRNNEKFIHTLAMTSIVLNVFPSFLLLTFDISNFLKLEVKILWDSFDLLSRSPKPQTDKN